MADFALQSSAFDHGAPIPQRHSCEGEDLSPPLSWSGLPEGTRSLALMVDDPDAPGRHLHPLARMGARPQCHGARRGRGRTGRRAQRLRHERLPGPLPADRFAFRRSGSLAPWWSWASEPCASWPATAAERYAGPWDRRTHNPVLVIGNTYDPNTPYRGARAMTRQLSRARLLTVDGYGHTELLNPSSCANRYVSRYLIARVLPPKGTRCKQDQAPFRGKP